MMARGGHCGWEGKDAGLDPGLTQPELWNQRGHQLGQELTAVGQTLCMGLTASLDVANPGKS